MSGLWASMTYALGITRARKAPDYSWKIKTACEIAMIST